MRKHKIKIIVTVMTIAVVGLIAMQVYWIVNVIKVEEERFERKVNDALLLVADKIDRDEAAQVITRKICGDKNGTIIINNDTLNRIVFEKSYPASSVKIIKADSIPTTKLQYHFKINDGDKKSEAQIHFMQTDSIGEERIIEKNFVWKAKTDSFVVRRKQLVDEVVTDMIKFNSSKKIEDRISNKRLNTLIIAELKNQSINTEYFFGVLKTGKDTLVLLKNGTDQAELMKSKLRAVLFPDEIFSTPNHLIVYFPNKNSYLLASIAGMLALSVFLILLVIGVFYKTLQMFIQQKKITEIKDDLINNITHEFKTPISTISVACEALQEPELTNEASAINKYTGIIKDENERLRMMVETFLNTAAYEKGSFQMTNEMINVNDVVKSAANKFSEIMFNKSGSFEIELNSNLPMINSDRFHLGNIIGNLIDNAIKYNENNPKILIKTDISENGIIISVKDNGIGISKDQQKKIFDTFYRVPTGNIHNVRGNGIGLSYSKQIITALGGEISVHSNAGEGSMFEIVLPLIQP